MYAGAFFHFDSAEEHWAYWSRLITINRYMDAPKPVYSELLELVKDKDYFVITTNVDHTFQKALFDKKRLFYTQGDYGLFQCSVPCRKETFDNEEIILKMYKAQKDMRIPSGLIPFCPRCGKPMKANLRSDDTFAEDEGWHEASRRYEDFLQKKKNGCVLFLELGVGFNTAAIIKIPFWSMTAQNKLASYACINQYDALCANEIRDRSICIFSDAGKVIEDLRAI